MRLTEVQYRRTVKRILTPLAAHLDDVIDRSFHSDSFRERTARFIRERLKIFNFEMCGKQNKSLSGDSP